MVSDGVGGHGESTLAVDGRDIYFYFDRKKKTPVLNGVNIAVTRGQIYSLIGPSGCGKTTLLKCILGRYKLQEGSLKIYGRAPGSKGFFIPGPGVGYMPQDLALYLEMTTKETLTYFGSLYRMSKKEIKERVSFLAEFLALPDRKKQLKYLSGGQQRRVSFAVALVHKPPLLILDEPTVGVDPLLRHNIWKHLADLANTEQTTIIITTHYVEEARQAEVVGLMRDGRLLVESNPDVLMKKYYAATLEDVFLRVCKDNHSEDDDLETGFDALTDVETHSPNGSARKYTAMWLTNGDSEQRSTDKNLLGKNEQAFIVSTKKANGHFGSDESNSNGICHGISNDHDKQCLEINNGHDNTTALLSPSSLPKEFGYTRSNFRESWMRFSCLTKKNLLFLKRNVFLLVFQLFIPTLQIAIFCLCVGSDPFDLPVAVVNMEEDPNGFGINYLTTLSNRTIHQKRFDNLSLAVNSVKSGEAWAAMYIGPQFSSCLVERFSQGADVLNETVECSDIKLYVDMSNKQIVGTIYTHLLRSYETFALDVLDTIGGNRLLADVPVKLEEPIYGSLSTSFIEFMAPGLVLAITYIMSVALTAMTILLEKKRGLLERTFVAGATALELLLALFVACVLTLVGQVALQLAFTFFVFNVPCNGPFIWVAVIVLFVGFYGMAYGLFISALCDNDYVALMIAMGSFYPNIFLSGTFWPVNSMRHYIRNLSYCLPLTLITNSLRCILSRGWNITNRHIWDGLLICNAWTLLFIILAMILFKYKK